MRSRRRSRTPRSLRSSGSFEAFVLDQLSGAAEVTSRKMFGGVGLYSNGVFFGIIARDTLYLKVDARNRPAFERAGSSPFKPYDDRPGTMQYYAVPIGVLESAPELASWMREAVAAAERQAERRKQRAR
jgi:DNA transformation protein